MNIFIFNRFFNRPIGNRHKGPTYVYFKKRVVGYYGLCGIKTVTVKVSSGAWASICLYRDSCYVTIDKEEYIRLGGEL
jgi:hypothetical protein